MSITSIEASHPVEVIGPNAITRMAEAISTIGGETLCREIFASAGLSAYLVTPPMHMIPAADAALLHAATIKRLGEDGAAKVSRRAGYLTGEYLLANRIPLIAQRVLKILPRRLAAHILVRAITRHAWTFAGGGAFSYEFSPQLALKLKGSPICRSLHTREPACRYFEATFERVFAEMLGPTLHVTEIECEATGALACIFEVRW